MKLSVVYVAVTGGRQTHDLAARFVGSWLECPPGVECDLIVACNGGPLPVETALLFSMLDTKFVPRENDAGWDISAYQNIANKTDSELLLCCGETVYWHKPGWLSHIKSFWDSLGPGMYGLYASHSPIAHLNTTAFAISPKHLLQYPPVRSHPERYEFEHGRTALWRKLNQFGVPVRLVTWDGCWEPGKWRMPPNILQRGDQRNCLAFCNHTDRWAAADPATQRHWAFLSDRAYQ